MIYIFNKKSEHDEYDAIMRGNLSESARKKFDAYYTDKRKRNYIIKNSIKGGLVGGGVGAAAGNIVGRVRRHKAGERAVTEASSGFKNKFLNAIDKNRLSRIKDAARKKISLTKHTLAGAGIGAGIGVGGKLLTSPRKYENGRFDSLQDSLRQQRLNKLYKEDLETVFRDDEGREKAAQQHRHDNEVKQKKFNLEMAGNATITPRDREDLNRRYQDEQRTNRLHFDSDMRRFENKHRVLQDELDRDFTKNHRKYGSAYGGVFS